MTRLSFGKLQNVPAIGKISGRSLTRRNSRAVPRDSIINIRARARARRSMQGPRSFPKTQD